jgi:hypothetical protein
MSRAHWTAGVRNDAIIAFLLFCLEVYRQSNNANERCTEDDPDALTVRAGNLAGRPEQGPVASGTGLFALSRRATFDFHYRSGCSAHWVKVKNPDAPAVKREADEDWGR